MFFNLSTRLQRTLWATAAASLAVMCSNPARANGIITTSRHADGGRLSVQTQTGTNCSATAPDRASVAAVAGSRSRDSSGNYDSNSSDLVAGVAVIIPFGGQSYGNCNKLLELEEARNRLDLAVTLFESGAITAEEFKETAERAKSALK